MRLYSKHNKDNLFDIFEVHLNLPKIKWGTLDGNAWTDDYPTKYMDVEFDTQFIYRNDNTSWQYFKLTLLGFGFTITKQNGY